MPTIVPKPLFPRFFYNHLRTLLVLLGALLPAMAAGQPTTAARGLPTLAPLVNQVTPAVVNVSVITPAPMEDNPLFRDPFFRRFFNLPDRPQRKEQAAGSGVIVDAARGLILTNHHVIKDAEQVIITLKDRRQFPAKLVGADPGTDIAVLQISAPGLTALRIGDSDALQVGDHVLAIGNPFGIGQTVTSGIVSALGRSGLSVEGYEDFIQTDASINPGNSGGALVNLRGELIGINTAILGPTGGNVGIGFAVPAAMAGAVMAQIVRHGEVRRGRLGIEMADVPQELQGKLRLPSLDGAFVTNVEAGSPAARAGLRQSDVIVALNARPIRTSGELRARLGLTPVGEEVEFSIIRDGSPQRIRTRIAPPQASGDGDARAVAQLPGLRVVEIERGSPLAEKLRGGGLVVAAVEPGSPALQAGFRPGDIIYAVNRRRVQTLAEFQGLLRAAQQAPLGGGSERGYAISLLRGDFNLTIILR
ncbi:MAG: Do family serine endopeptidase [Betaproteobacteria bacterium]|jgi:Do/DeqQ family serine protease|nr:Do family serine endopeptidase [Betaproteobacteria bacterium]MDH5341358.1 Do family serine endopeptidase [Betaproteobacteria bacterium]